jgi:predicted PurR-regulated permease PerM
MRIDAPPALKESGFLTGVVAAVLAAIIVGTLYFGREIFVPIALAILLSFVLAPLVRLLQSWYVPRGLSVIGVVLFAFLAIFAVGGVIATQLAQLAEDLPRYELTMREKIKSLRGSAATSGTLERAADVLRDLGKEIEKPKERAGEAATSDVQRPEPNQQSRPIPVEVRQPPPSAMESVATLITPLLYPLATTGIIIIFVIFILLQREDLRNRFIKLAGSHDLQKTTSALDDAARRLSRLFLIQLALNAAFGVLIGVGLWVIGVPSPVLWGILAGVLRFVPYIGAFIAAAFPLALAAAVDPGWSMLLWTVALFLVIEPIVGHVVEPMVYGHSTGLSPVAVVVSATFWTALWGPIGLVLATPLTICLVVLGRHVERLKFLDVMFGDRPALSPPEIFYQRMLAGDPAEAVEKAEEFLKEKPLSAYYDEVAMKGLKLAQGDVSLGSLALPRIQRIRESVAELVDDLAEQDDRQLEQGVSHDAEAAAAVETIEEKTIWDLPVVTKEELAPEWQTEFPVLCIAGRSDLDEGPANMLAQLLGKHGLAARVEGVEAISTSNIFRLDVSGVAMVCLSYLDVSSPAHVRYSIRRLRRKLPKARILFGCWLCDEHTTALHETVKADVIATSLREAVALCLETSRTPVAAKQTVQSQTPLASSASG